MFGDADWRERTRMGKVALDAPIGSFTDENRKIAGMALVAGAGVGDAREWDSH